MSVNFQKVSENDKQKDFITRETLNNVKITFHVFTRDKCIRTSS